MGLLPDITGLLDDPDVGGGQSFTILRTTFVRVKGRASAYEQSAIPATGSVQPADRNQLEQLPEGDRDRAVLVIRSKTPILMGDSDTLTDEILYHGERYKVLRTAEWQRWGMYVAYATRAEPAVKESTPAPSVEGGGT